MYRRYYSYNDMPTLTPPKQADKREEIQKKEPPKPQKPSSETKKILGRFETDDIILLAVIFFLLADECDDLPLLLALAFIFFNN